MQQPPSNVMVTVRVRPLNPMEQAFQASRKEQNVVRVVDETTLCFDPDSAEDIDIQNSGSFGQKNSYRFGNPTHNNRRAKNLQYTFDRVFDETATQEEVYENTTKFLIDSIFDAYNATVFAYGATGAGKTHTITGTPDSPGVMVLLMKDLFDRIESVSSAAGGLSIIPSVSYLEVYNETIRDLLVSFPDETPSPGKPPQLEIREDERGIYVPGLSEHTPKSLEDVLQLLAYGNKNRTMCPTEANAYSSRSHAVLQITIKQKIVEDSQREVKEQSKTGVLSVIDLAGSERASVTKNRGERLWEGANINRSLLALGNCINALCEISKSKSTPPTFMPLTKRRRRDDASTEKVHIPYRDSKLTRLLKYSLMGKSHTVMICNVSPSQLHREDTHNTLKYANRAKNIKLKLDRNILSGALRGRRIDEYIKLIAALRKEIEDLKKSVNSPALSSKSALPPSKGTNTWMLPGHPSHTATAPAKAADMPDPQPLLDTIKQLHEDHMYYFEERSHLESLLLKSEHQQRLLKHRIACFQKLAEPPLGDVAFDESRQLCGALESQREVTKKDLWRINQKHLMQYMEKVQKIINNASTMAQFSGNARKMLTSAIDKDVEIKNLRDDVRRMTAKIDGLENVIDMERQELERMYEQHGSLIIDALRWWEKSAESHMDNQENIENAEDSRSTDFLSSIQQYVANLDNVNVFKDESPPILQRNNVGKTSGVSFSVDLPESRPLQSILKNKGAFANVSSAHGHHVSIVSPRRETVSVPALERMKSSISEVNVQPLMQSSTKRPPPPPYQPNTTPRNRSRSVSTHISNRLTSSNRQLGPDATSSLIGPKTRRLVDNPPLQMNAAPSVLSIENIDDDREDPVPSSYPPFRKPRQEQQNEEFFAAESSESISPVMEDAHSEPNSPKSSTKYNPATNPASNDTEGNVSLFRRLSLSSGGSRGQVNKENRQFSASFHGTSGTSKRSVSTAAFAPGGSNSAAVVVSSNVLDRLRRPTLATLHRKSNTLIPPATSAASTSVTSSASSTSAIVSSGASNVSSQTPVPSFPLQQQLPIVVEEAAPSRRTGTKPRWK